jgi:hypothetical protein
MVETILQPESLKGRRMGYASRLQKAGIKPGPHGFQMPLGFAPDSRYYPELEAKSIL